MPNTKVISTLGPATDNEEILRQLLLAGTDVVRLNAAHSTPDEHKRRIDAVRKLSAELGKHVGILLDLAGPKIRLGRFKEGKVQLKTGELFKLTTLPVVGDETIASTNYEFLAQDVAPGDRVLLADGAIELRVLSTDGVTAECEVVRGGSLKDHQGINLPNVNLRVPSLTEKDLEYVEFAVREQVDFIGLSFVRSADDVAQLKERLKALNSDIPVVAKIEKPQAWENLEEILDASEGVMVARGDLGVEMELHKVPYIQKHILRLSRMLGRFSITATQMLESMIENPVPTRAEVSDVANAIYDGTHAVMLSAETSVGKYPVEAVTMMQKIIAETEQHLRPNIHDELLQAANPSGAEVIADAAIHAARHVRPSAIVVFTTTGATARLLARYRIYRPIYAFVPSETVARRLSVVFGVRPIVTERLESTDEMMRVMDRILLDRGHVRKGMPVIFVAGQPIGIPGSTNMIKLHRVGEVA